PQDRAGKASHVFLVLMLMLMLMLMLVIVLVLGYVIRRVFPQHIGTVRKPAEQADKHFHNPHEALLLCGHRFFFRKFAHEQSVEAGRTFQRRPPRHLKETSTIFTRELPVTFRDV